MSEPIPTNSTVIVRRSNPGEWIAWLLNFDPDGRPVPGDDLSGAIIICASGARALVRATDMFNASESHQLRKPRGKDDCWKLKHKDALRLWEEFYG